jgi:hypothetical protein
MESDNRKNTTRQVQIPSDVLDQMREDFDRASEYQQISALDSIREEYGIGWAIYASAFMGREVDVWRVKICEVLNG